MQDVTLQGKHVIKNISWLVLFIVMFATSYDNGWYLPLSVTIFAVAALVLTCVDDFDSEECYTVVQFLHKKLVFRGPYVYFIALPGVLGNYQLSSQVVRRRVINLEHKDFTSLYIEFDAHFRQKTNQRFKERVEWFAAQIGECLVIVALAAAIIAFLSILFRTLVLNWGEVTFSEALTWKFLVIAWDILPVSLIGGCLVGVVILVPALALQSRYTRLWFLGFLCLTMAITTHHTGHTDFLLGLLAVVGSIACTYSLSQPVKSAQYQLNALYFDEFVAQLVGRIDLVLHAGEFKTLARQDFRAQQGGIELAINAKLKESPPLNIAGLKVRVSLDTEKTYLSNAKVNELFPERLVSIIRS
jgi:hypothetical protein